MLTTVNDKYRAGDLIPFLLVYWLTVQNGREDLVYQRSIRGFKLGRGDPFVDNALRRGIVTEIDPV